jgi:hypothetical protein
MVKNKEQGPRNWISEVNHLLANKFWVKTLQAIDNGPMLKNLEVVIQ